MFLRITLPIVLLSLILPLLLLIGGMAGLVCMEGPMDASMTAMDDGPSACCLEGCGLRVSDFAAALNCNGKEISRTSVLAKFAPKPMALAILALHNQGPPGVSPPDTLVSTPPMKHKPSRYPEVARYTLFHSLLI